MLLFHGPYHPGVDIGLDFISWGLAWGFAITILMWTAEMDYPDDCQYEYKTPGFCPHAKTLMAMEVLSSILALVYGYVFLLFAYMKMAGSL